MKNIDAYLIKDTHLKLGSKIHISDFVFAKRLFQKSAYASKFAYNIAHNIYHAINPPSNTSNFKGEFEFRPKIEYKEIILIGYAYYSELLTSRTELILKNVFNISNVSHIIIDNEREINFNFYFKKQCPINCQSIKKNKNEKYLYCIITPISSTLTTPIKLENEFYRQIKTYCLKKCNLRENGKCSIIDDSELEIHNQSIQNIQNKFDFTTLPFQTIVVVGNKKINEGYYGTPEDTEINSLNYWKRIEIKDKYNNDIKEIITSNRLFNENERINQFHIYVKSEWERIHSCSKCFPKNPLNEKPLFEADKSLLTPDFIYELPKSAAKKLYNETYFVLNNDIDKTKIEKPFISNEMLKYGHFRGKNKHFFYYIKYPEFFNSNDKLIIKWAQNLRSKNFNSRLNESSRILLITPDKSTSGRFAFAINRYVFNESCNIISYNPHEENISNFDKFFSNWLINAGEIETHVFYVDNLLAKGNTALAVHDAVKLVRQKSKKGKEENMPGLAGVFTMINRLDIYDFENIKRKIRQVDNNQFNDIFSFSSLNFPVIQTITDEKGKETGCYLCKSLENYKLLANDCSLDNIRQYISEKNLSKRELKSKYEETFSLNETKEFGEKIRLKRLCISHQLFNSLNDSSITDFLITVNNENDFKKFRTEFRSKHLKDYNHELISDFELKCLLIKVLSEPPFIIYKDIKKKVFSWILYETEVTLNNVVKNIDIKIYDEDELHYLRLLIKKGSQINVNYLISTQCLISLLKLSAFEENLIQDLLISKSVKLKRFLNFRFLIISSIKESLFNNEPKAIKLEENLLKPEVIDASKINIYSRRLYESLIFENTGVIRQALKATEFLFENSELEYSNVKEAKVEDENKLKLKLSELYEIKDNKIYNINRFIFPQSHEQNGFFENHAKPFISSLALYRYLKILTSFKPEKTENISNSSEYLLSQLCKILNIDTNDGGAFLLLKYQDIAENPFDNQNLHVISRFGAKSKDLVEKLEKSNNSFSKVFLKGYEFEIESVDNNTKYFWTAISASQTNNIWKFQEHKQNPIVNPANNFSEFEFNTDLNRFYFIRICNWHFDYNNRNKLSIIPQAVIVFFDNQNIEFKPQETRYALSLRNEISDFITNNFENDAFKALIESEKKIDEYIGRYSKNTHGVYFRLREIEHLAAENFTLFAICSDVFVGHIHYSLLIKTDELEYGTNQRKIEELFNKSFFKLITDFLVDHSFNIV